ncbi:hypothetical protein [Streptomyces sp. NPDC046261]|uniref:hypothetical protein n=1 Tax=Streptomyces sp. NPDC046261 TaxID=3157200 RepID=UPI0033DF0C95
MRQAATTAVVVLAAGLGLGAAHAGAQAQPRADYQAVAHPVTGRVGQTVEVELGVRNGGPGPTSADGVVGGSRAYEVVAPEGTTIVAAPPCRAAGSGDDRTYLCAIGEDFPAGDRETLRFRVRIDEKVDGAEGHVRIVGRDENPEPDPDPGNDSAPIPVEVTDAAPAPKAARPGGHPGTLLIATTSGTALSAGAVLLGLLGAVRRRAH